MRHKVAQAREIYGSDVTLSTHKPYPKLLAHAFSVHSSVVDKTFWLYIYRRGSLKNFCENTRPISVVFDGRVRESANHRTKRRVPNGS